MANIMATSNPPLNIGESGKYYLTLKKLWSKLHHKKTKYLRRKKWSSCVNIYLKILIDFGELLSYFTLQNTDQVLSH